MRRMAGGVMVLELELESEVVTESCLPVMSLTAGRVVTVPLSGSD